MNKVQRKHGARSSALARPGHGSRLVTQLTFEKRHGAYLWLTDRGKSRVLKF